MDESIKNQTLGYKKEVVGKMIVIDRIKQGKKEEKKK